MRFEGANHGCCDIEAAIRIRWVFCVSQDGFFKVICEEDGAFGGNSHQKLQLGAAGAVESRAVVDLLDEFG